MKYVNKKFRVILALLLFAVLPYSAHLLNKKYSPTSRGPASDSALTEAIAAASFDLSETSPEDFKKAFKYQILKDVSVKTMDQSQQLYLGLFLIKNEKGEPVFVCDQYPTLDLIFAADGVAISGEIPHMIVRSPCLVAHDQKHIESYPIPLQRIYQSPLSHEFVIESVNSQESGRIYFRGVVERWPQDWNLVGIKLYGKNPTNVLEINGYEVISVLGEPLTISVSP